MPITDHAAYLDHAFLPPDEIIEQAERCLAGIKFDTFVGRGLSGALVVPTLARGFGKSFGIVRKPEDKDNHSGRTFEGVLGGRWVFVDDLISTGATLYETHNAVRTRAKSGSFRTRCVGAYLYSHSNGEVWDAPKIAKRLASFEDFYLKTRQAA